MFRLLIEAAVCISVCELPVACGKPFFNPPPRPPTLEDTQTIPLSPQAIQEIHVDHKCGMIRCPDYAYTLNRDGRATYEGRDRVPTIGHYVSTIDSSDFQALASLLIKSGFFSWPRRSNYCDDCEERSILAMFDSTGKEQRFYEPAFADWRGSALLALEMALDSAADQLKWAAAQ